MSDAGCYCGVIEYDKNLVLKCDGCQKNFHIDCLKSGKLSTLQGDTFFNLKCMKCGKNGEEEIERSKLPWVTIVSLALYNLQLSGQGRQGYFRWKEHICAYIDKHWSILLGPHKKKTSLWYGTVAGALSSGCPKYFQSGSKDLGETGWWRLTEMKAPVFKPSEIAPRKGKRSEGLSLLPSLKVEGLRSRNKKSSIELAIELKEKRLQTKDIKQIKKELTEKHQVVGQSNSIDEQPAAKKSKLTISKTETLVVAETRAPSVVRLETLSTCELEAVPETSSQTISCINTETPPAKIESEIVNNSSKTLPNSNVIIEESCETVESFLTSDDSQFSLTSLNNQDLMTSASLIPKETLPTYLFEDEEDEDNDLEIDPGSISPLRTTVLDEDSLSLDDILSTILDKSSETIAVDKIKREPQEESDKEVTNSNNESEGNDDDDDDDDDCQPEDKITEERSEDGGSSTMSEESSIIQPIVKIKQQEESPRYNPISLYDERTLLSRLNQAAENDKLSPQLTRFRRKLIVRQLKRERGIPLFDFDREVNKNLKFGALKDRETNVPYTRFPHGDLRVLDRFQGGVRISLHLEPERPSFLNRLVGTEDDQLQSIKSPYTTRILKPFIRRDYESRPLKMQLLEEIKAYHHRQDPCWNGTDPAPIDYCYVRPQHIPSVNILCQQFFWPGIDLSECLHYPDFSCVVLFRKIVIGFAFMVPDVKYNEAYISFLFTHPEWRRAGIAKFMVYHLIQTCMGKDVTLHVSATNPAMLLYQNFGFKPEEFLLDFYDKYYPLDSKECKHAFFLRLRR